MKKIKKCGTPHIEGGSLNGRCIIYCCGNSKVIKNKC